MPFLVYEARPSANCRRARSHLYRFVLRLTESDTAGSLFFRKNADLQTGTAENFRTRETDLTKQRDQNGELLRKVRPVPPREVFFRLLRAFSLAFLKINPFGAQSRALFCRFGVVVFKKET